MWTIFRGQRNVGWNMIRPVNHQKNLLKYWFRKLAKMTVIHHAPNLCTLFKNYSKCRIWFFKLLYFPLIFVQLKLTCLVTLFDRKLHAFKNSPKWSILGIFHELLSTQIVTAECWMRLFLWFSNTVYCKLLRHSQKMVAKNLLYVLRVRS